MYFTNSFDSVSAFHVRSRIGPPRNLQARFFWHLYDTNGSDFDSLQQISHRNEIPEKKNGPSSPALAELSSDSIIKAAEKSLENYQARKNEIYASGGSSWQSSRRLFLASAAIGSGLAATSIADGAAASLLVGSADTSIASSGSFNIGRLEWEATPVNRRTGVTVFDAEQYGYNVRFVTYLSRFLLNFDDDCQKWWYSRAADLPRLANAEEVENLRLEQFGAFSASVEVGLQEYKEKEGPRRLLESLLRRYCPSVETLKASREVRGLPPLKEDALSNKESEIREAKRQIALLFGLMENNQPVEQITKVLAAIDNGSIASIEVKNTGSGYAPGYGPPLVTFPEPNAGPDYERATGRAVLRQNGKVLRVDVVNRGNGYVKAPTITISSPALLRFGNSTTAKPASAKAFLFRSGANKGRIERIQLTDPGAGYSEKEIIRVKLSPPELSPLDGGVSATAAAIREYEVSDIQIVNQGSGYAVERPIPVVVEPPPLTARVNMNDPLTARIISPDEPLPMTTIPSEAMLTKMPKSTDPSSVVFKVQEASKGGGSGGSGGGGCIGRACYDKPVVAVAYPRAEKDTTSYSSFRDEDSADSVREQRVLSGSTSGPASRIPLIFQTPSSTQLLSLLPAGIGLEFDEEEKRYVLGVAAEYQDFVPDWFEKSSSNRPLFPEFGPRGRSPIERDMDIGIGAYLRFVASGAICCSVVHLAVTPIDVVKTKLQTDPSKYTGVVSTFKSVLDNDGPSSFFTGWAPTFVGYFVWGGVVYAFTEFLRRYFKTLAGVEAVNYEVFIILLAAGIAAFVGAYVICPFEAVRIRSVAQPNFAPNILKVLTRMLNEEGFISLFSAVPAFLTKEVPFAMAKFTVFDLSTAWMYETFPATREDVQLSLVVSLAGGTLGGLFAGVVSHPADTVISEMKKAKTERSPIEALEIVLDRGGPAALFTGLGLRLLFVSLIVSFQFFLYDTVRFALGIGTDDLKLYLDVLGGALRAGPV